MTREKLIRIFFAYRIITYNDGPWPPVDNWTDKIKETSKIYCNKSSILFVYNLNRQKTGPDFIKSCLFAGRPVLKSPLVHKIVRR